MGFTLGTVIRNSAGAIVGYFVYMFVLPTLSGVLAAYQSWFRDAREWVDFQWMTTRLFDGGFNATDWVQLGVSGVLWLVLPLAIGITLLMRSEVK
jgi:ABC-2 type transport system permease protein